MSNQEQIEKSLRIIYKDNELAERLAADMAQRFVRYRSSTEKSAPLSEKDAILITYGDTLQDGVRAPLQVLEEFLKTYVGDAIDTIHLLPMYPYTSDDGFSVTDYLAISPELGTWDDIYRLNDSYHLMFDAVINHISKSSEWFQKFLKGDKKYRNYFITADPEADYSAVIRPRTLPLLTAFDTAAGTRHVWTTFSEDQIDLNYKNPEVLMEIAEILLIYAHRGG